MMSLQALWNIGGCWKEHPYFGDKQGSSVTFVVIFYLKKQQSSRTQNGTYSLEISNETMSCQILIHSVYKHNSPGSFTLIRLKQTPGLRRFLARPTRKLQYYPKPLQDGLHLTRERPRFGVGTGLILKNPVQN